MTEHLWPDVPATLFGADSEDRFPMTDAHVGYVLKRQDVHAYREGYRRGATLLAERAHAWDQPPEFLIWPIAWLWRHYLELALKETIALGAMVHDESSGWSWPAKAGHLLAELWNDALPSIVPHGESNAPELQNVEAIIAEFAALDPSGTGFRYAADRRGGQSLPTAPNHINVGLLNETMQRIANFLDAVREILSGALERLQEMRAASAQTE